MKIIHLIAGMAVAFPFTTATFAQGPLVAPAMVTVRGEDTGLPEFDVDYSYQIGRFEVMAEEYVAFLNAVAASDPYGLYQPAMSTDTEFGKLVRRSGEPGSYTYEKRSPEKFDDFDGGGIYRTGGGVDGWKWPIGYVSFHSAARFCNWLHNGATNGADTETGAYTLNGATSGVLPPRNPGAKYWLPSRKEWFKAAYFNPYTLDFNQYPMDTIEGQDQGAYLYPWYAGFYDPYKPGIHNWVHANYRSSRTWGAVFEWGKDSADEMVYVEGYCVLRPCGSYYHYYDRPAFGGVKALNTYGTFDMGGNVAEWTEDGGLRGGSAYDSEIAMDKDQNDADYNGTASAGTSSTTGFRVASLAGQHTFYVTNGYIDVDLPGEIIAPFGVYIYKPDHQVSGGYDAYGDFEIRDNRRTCGVPTTGGSIFTDKYVPWPRWVGGWYPDGTTHTFWDGFDTVTYPNYWSVFSKDFNERDGLPASGRYAYSVGGQVGLHSYASTPLNNYYITLKTVPAPAPSPIESAALGTNGFSMSWLNKHAYVKFQRRTSLTEGDWETIGGLDTRFTVGGTIAGQEPVYRARSWHQSPKTFTDPAPPAGSAFYRIKVD